MVQRSALYLSPRLRREKGKKRANLCYNVVNAFRQSETRRVRRFKRHDAAHGANMQPGFHAAAHIDYSQVLVVTARS